MRKENFWPHRDSGARDAATKMLFMKIYNLGNRVVNNYLVSLDEDGYVLIDTGYADGFKGFTKKLEETGVTPKEIKYVFLTHAHDDHAGFPE